MIDQGKPDEGAWYQRAGCDSESADLFFNTRPTGALLDRALGVCATCPVTVECLADAIRRGEEMGIRGGLANGVRLALERQVRAEPGGHSLPALTVARRILALALTKSSPEPTPPKRPQRSPRRSKNQ